MRLRPSSRFFPTLLAIPCLVAGTIRPALAQQRDSITDVLQSPVRFRIARERFVGRPILVAGDSVLVQVAAGPRSAPTFSQQWLQLRCVLGAEVSTGKSSPRQASFRGTIFGVAFGLAVGAAIGKSQAHSRHQPDPFRPDIPPKTARLVTRYALSGGAAGAVLGAVIGRRYPSERWTPLALPPHAFDTARCQEPR